MQHSPRRHRRFILFSLKTVACFVLAILMFCSGTVAISPASQTIPNMGTILYASDKRPYADGAIIRDRDGSPFIMVGVFKMRSLTYYANPNWWDDEVDGAYDLIKAAGSNVVHLALNKYLWKNVAQYKPAIDGLVAKCKARGLYVVMDFHTEYNPATGQDLRNFTQMITDAASGGASEWKDFIVEIATRYKDEPTVIGIDPLDECPPNAVTQDVWKAANLNVIDAIQAVDPSYLIFVGAMPRGTLTKFYGEPYPRSNIAYDSHIWYPWDVGFGGYADAYYYAETEEDFQEAYERMRTFYQNYLTFFRDQYNVPVGIGSTSIGKVAYHLEGQPPLKNAYRQFMDQMKLFEELGIYGVYFPADRDFSDGLFWGLLKADNATQWSEAGIVYRDAIDQYFASH